MLRKLKFYARALDTSIGVGASTEAIISKGAWADRRPWVLGAAAPRQSVPLNGTNLSKYIKYIVYCCVMMLGTQMGPAHSQSSKAALFGRQVSILDIALSPRGDRIAFVAPGKGRSTILYVAATSGGKATQVVLATDGDPVRLSRCFWNSETRLICRAAATVTSEGKAYEATQLIAVDADGGNARNISLRLEGALNGGRLIDWMPNGNNEVLIERYHAPEIGLRRRSVRV